MTLSDLRLSKQERFCVKVLLEIRKRLRDGRAEEALVFVQATLDALHSPRPPKEPADDATDPTPRRS